MAGTHAMPSQADMFPWQPTPTSIPPECQRIMQDLAAAGTSYEYVLKTRYDAQGAGDLLRSWGLPLPVVLAGYLMECDGDLIRRSEMPEADGILRHIREAARHARDIEEEHLHKLLNPPYNDLDALLLSIATYYQALKRLQEQSNGKPYAGDMFIHIESIGRTLLNIAKRLGIWYFKRQIEDISEQLRDPAKFDEDQQEYQEILRSDAASLARVRQLLEQSYRQVIQEPITIVYNTCSIAGMRRRMQDAHTSATSEMAQLTGFDLVTFDVIVPTIRDCYMAFGIFSQLGVIQDRVSDLIANPKPNGSSYIAFGLTLTAHHELEQAITCQFQISTRMMQAITKYGCLYPDSRSLLEAGQSPRTFPESDGLFWNHGDGKVLQVVQQAIASSVNTGENPIIVYDKHRRPIALPLNATALDFAYALGKDVGNIAVEAIVNSRKAPLYRQLESGDMVEIRTARQIQANEAWLDYAVTPGAKQDIRAAQLSMKAVQGGYALLLGILRRYHFVLTLRELEEELRLLFKRHKELGGTQQEFLERIGGFEREHDMLNWAAQEIMRRLSKYRHRMLQGHDRSLWVPVIDSHLERKLTYHEQRICSQCRPSYPRDEKIVGRLRRRDGSLIVHRETCAHLVDHPSGRHSILVPMNWQPQSPAFHIAFRVMVQDRRGLILDLARQLRRHNCDLTEISAEAANPKTGIGYMSFTIETHSEHDVLDIWEELYKIDNIVEVMIDPEKTPASICESMNALYQNRETLARKTVIEFAWEEKLNALPLRRHTLRSPFDISRPPAPKMFFGRSEETRIMWRELCEGEQGRALLLYGPRRSGKSSVCHNFLGSQVYAPNWGALISLQNAVGDTESAILKLISERVSGAFREQLDLSAPTWDDFQESDPQVHFKRVLQACIERLPNARVVLALDEFGGAIESLNSGNLDVRFFTFWKELMAEISQLSLIIALPTSSHYKLFSEKLASAFNFAQTLPMEFLDIESAKRLLADPLHELDIAIHPNTVAQAVKLTGGSPYYLALIGNELINQLNRDVPKQVVDDKTLKMVVDQFLESGAIQNFEFYSAELQNEQEFTVLETMVDYFHRTNQMEMQLTRIASQAQMRLPVVHRHLDRLRTGLILEENSPESNPFYSFKIDLLGRWLSRNRWFFTRQN